MKTAPKKSTETLITELRQFHHYESASRLQSFQWEIESLQQEIERLNRKSWFIILMEQFKKTTKLLLKKK